MNTPRVTPIDRPKLVLPNNGDKLLLHSCCAPCSGEVMEALLASGIDYTIYFYNPNIHPLKEYEIRKNENIRFAEQHGVPFIDADYDVDNWFERAKGMEYEPERGIRCTMCFDMRFERTALYAHEHGFPVISSSLGISRWKNMAQINDCGQALPPPTSRHRPLPPRKRARVARRANRVRRKAVRCRRSGGWYVFPCCVSKKISLIWIILYV